jgi:predicted small metal-binding protein
MKSRIVLAAFALALVCTTSAWSQAQEMKKEAKKTMEHGAMGKMEAGKGEMAALKTFTCPDPCDFSVSSRDEKEITDAVIAHAKKHHNMTMTEKDVMSKTMAAEPKADKK